MYWHSYSYWYNYAYWYSYSYEYCYCYCYWCVKDESTKGDESEWMGWRLQKLSAKCPFMQKTRIKLMALVQIR